MTMESHSPEQPMSYDRWFASLEEAKQMEVLDTLRKAAKQLDQMPAEIAEQHGVSKEALERLIADLEKGK